MEKLKKILGELRALPRETEWVEFKHNNYNPQKIGENISALANSACLLQRDAGYLVFGIEDETHNVIGSDFKPHQAKKGNEELENWLARKLEPRIDFRIYEFPYEGKIIIVFKIDPALNVPVKFQGNAYIRIGSYTKKLDQYQEKARKIWSNKQGFDWSAQICDGATIDDLDPQAIIKARQEYKIKFPKLANEVDSWSNAVFLNKAKITIHGKVTRAAIILLGKPESTHFILPGVVQISWILRDDKNIERDYEHFGPPFILNTDAIILKIRNLNYRYLPNSTLFPIEVTQYEPYVIREALHNCIAHQDYELCSRIIIVEKNDELLFVNAGSFIPCSVEAVIEQDAPQRYYRNQFLTVAMVNCNMIDTVGGGIKKMFQKQRERFFPLPTYELEKENKVSVHITGKIINENYTRLLMENSDLDIGAVILLDKVQKGRRLNKEEVVILRGQKLIEGRYPNLFVASKIAAADGHKASYIKNRTFDEGYYKQLIINFIKEYGSATRKEIDDLLLEKLSDILKPEQKKIKINNLLNRMANKEKSIKNVGSDRSSKWVLVKAGD